MLVPLKIIKAEEKDAENRFTLSMVEGEVMFSNEQKGNRCFKIGDHVRIRFKGEEGTIIDINGQHYMVCRFECLYLQ